jgi:hypothetical protein
MHKRLPVIVLGISAALILTGCSSTGPVVGDAIATAGSSATPNETPMAEVGTRDNAVPPGTPAKYSRSSMWTFTVGATDADAWPEVLATNEYNTTPADGNTYVTVPVHVVADDIDAAKAGADPWASFQWDYVTAAGNTFGSTTCMAVLQAPGEISLLGTMYNGAQADFLACAVVPVADIPGGTWKVTSLVDSASGAFFAGA